MKARAFVARFLVLVLTLTGSPALWAQRGSPELPNPGSTHVSREQQEKIGAQAITEVYQQMPVLPDSSPVTRYVQDLGRRLVSVIPSQNSWPYQFHVIQEKEINAFALPGGPIFINIGTIQAADNEAELVGVMSHEMSHIYMQHSAKAMPKQAFAQIFAGVLGAVLPGSGLGNLARLGIQIGAGTILMKYSRTDEAQADAVGAIIMYKAGYNPKALADFFRKLEQQGGAGGPQFLSDHPNPGNRTQSISKEISGWPPQNYRGDSGMFASTKQEAGRIKAYTAKEIADGAKQGIWAQQNRRNGALPANAAPAPQENNPGGNGPGAGTANIPLNDIRPSSRFTEYRHNDFTISYPDNWKAANDNNGLVIAPEAGLVQGNIAYGVMIGSNQDQNAQSLDQATQNLIQGLQQSNPGMQASESLKDVRVSGVQGRTVYLSSSSPLSDNGRPLAERDWLVTLPHPRGGLMYLVFVSPEKDFGELRSTYQKMLDSFQLR